ncbi:SDR family oxidoreductase [Olivibacter sitiensis]|uniref:SDR family oxidoreductase n=1 Tax=Olivibacter sitiensis TaxID=376470 RepID=UPI0004804F3B|nr:SDR family oxidoreductase [Olivibacter sitiensis]
MKIDLTGKKALVGGSSKGIGAASALLLAQAGAEVTLMARDEDQLHATCAQLDRSHEQKHGFIVADFSYPDDVLAKVKAHMDERGGFDLLINNTGGPKPAPLLADRPEKLELAFRQHILMSQELAQLLVPYMKAKFFGRIINIISTSVKAPIPGLGTSNVIRGAMASWSKTLATELASYGITVNNVLPGSTDTDRIRSMVAQQAEEQGKSEDEVKQAMEAQIPMGRFAHAEEIAAAVVFLASSQASYITGINLPVDGGRMPCL